MDDRTTALLRMEARVEASRSQWAGDEWIEKSLGRREITPFGRIVANILGAAFRGIYHIPTSRLSPVRWEDPSYLTITIFNDLPTYDGSLLTYLVVLAHDAEIRLSIEPCNPRYLRLVFCLRHGRSEGISHRHPTMEEAIRLIREAVADVRMPPERNDRPSA